MKKHTVLMHLDRSYKKLLEAFEIPLSQPLAIDGTIRRFEFTYEIACEAINTFFRGDALPKSHRNCLVQALSEGWIDDPDTWLALITSKNHAAFAFCEQLSKDVYDTVRKNHYVFDHLIASCRKMNPLEM